MLVGVVFLMYLCRTFNFQSMFSSIKSHFLLLFCLLVAGCGHETTWQNAWVELDSLCNIDPELALMQLDSLGANVSSFEEADRMRWELLRTKARDKAFINHTSDSVMKQVVDYYERKGNAVEQAEAQYYLASVYRDLHDSPRAVAHFLKALDLSETAEQPDAGLMMRSCSQMQGFYAKQLNFDKALEMGKRGVEIGRKYDILTPTLLADVAITYIRQSDTLSALSYYEDALKMIREEGLKGYYNAAIVAELLAVYSSCHMRAKADSCLAMLRSIPSDELPQNYLSNMTCYFYNLGIVDSAVIYYRKLWEHPKGIYSKKDASQSLMSLYHQLGRFDSASYYGVMYAMASDSVEELLKRERTQNALNEYQYQRDMEAEAAAYREASEARMKWLVTVAASIVVILLGILYHVNRQLQKELLIKKQERMIVEKDKALDDADAAIQKKQEQNDYLSQLMLSANSDQLPEEVWKLFQDAAMGKVRITTDTQWQQLMVAIDRLYPQFTQSVLERCPDISPDKMHIACLIKTGMDKTSIKNITELPKSTFYRLLNQMKGELGDLLLP